MPTTLLAETSLLTLDRVIVQVLENNPELKLNDYDALSAAARIRAARQTPPVHLNVELENFAGSGSRKGTDALETTLSLSKVFELGDKADLRGEVAQHNAKLVTNHQEARRLDIIAQAARRFIHVLVDQHRLQIAQDKLDLKKRTHKVVTRRVNAGRSPRAEKRRTSMAMARAEIELEHAEHELESSRLKLATMWGEVTPVFSKAQADLFALQQVNDFAQLEKLLANNPDLVRFATRQRLAEARLNLAKAKSSADIEFNAGVRNYQITDDNAFLVSASIPFGLESRAAPAIEVEDYQLQKQPFNYEKQRLALYSSLFEVYQELKHAYTAIKVLRQKIIPEAQKVLSDIEKGYAVGRYSFLELTDAQQILLNAQLESVMTAANYHRYKIEIDRLTGARFVAAPQSTGVQP
ncbi:MAG: TolC family protein [Thioalkalispiraceae bacterium]|jgi:cobalt-zinc-cadmium efflux system outer membrane protein